jgi:hypothetical protein
MTLGMYESSKTSLSGKKTIFLIPSIPSRTDAMASGHPIHVKPPFFTIPSTLKKALSTSTIDPSCKLETAFKRAIFQSHLP